MEAAGDWQNGNRSCPGIPAVILGRVSIGDAYKRGERDSVIAMAGFILGWIGVAVPVVLVIIFFFMGSRTLWIIPAEFVILGLFALVIYYTRPNNRRRNQSSW